MGKTGLMAGMDVTAKTAGMGLIPGYLVLPAPLERMAPLVPLVPLGRTGLLGLLGRKERRAIKATRVTRLLLV